MDSINSVTLSGNLTKDPENFGKDTPVVKFGLAVTRSYKPKDSEEYTEEVSFIDVTVFGNFGGLCARKLKKGDRATVQGRLKQDQWEDQDGNKRYAVYCIAEKIDSDGFYRKKDEENTASEAPASEAPADAAPSADDDIPF